jgi:hypothetical protein
MPAGRPTVYKPEYAEMARIACILGATNLVLAGQFGVARSTVDRWIADIPDFRDAVRSGRELADAKVACALFARATGMKHEATRVFCHDGKPVTVTYTVELPPDVRACIYWLRNRQPELWRENRRLVTSGPTFEALEEASGQAARHDDEAEDAPGHLRTEADLHDMASRLNVLR